MTQFDFAEQSNMDDFVFSVALVTDDYSRVSVAARQLKGNRKSAEKRKRDPRPSVPDLRQEKKTRPGG